MLTSPLRLRARGRVVQGLRNVVVIQKAAAGPTLGRKLLSHSNPWSTPGLACADTSARCSDTRVGLHGPVHIDAFVPLVAKETAGRLSFLARCDWCGHQNGCSLSPRQTELGNGAPVRWFQQPGRELPGQHSPPLTREGSPVMGSRAGCVSPLTILQLTDRCGEVVTAADLRLPSVRFHLPPQKHTLTGMRLARSLKGEAAEVR